MRTSNIETHQAESAYECHACRTQIDKGQRYTRVRVWDGDEAKTVKMHMGCAWTLSMQSRLKADLAFNGKAEQEGRVRA